MAQSVSLWGATYNQVPALDVPKTGGGTARFTDASITTAVESDVASGKVFIKADGSQGTGTNSGGGGGGATNVVLGEFTVPTYSSSNPYGDISIPYTGNGHPVAAMIYVKNGVYNNTPSTTQATWYNGIKRYAIGFWAMSKSDTTTTPTFTSATEDMGTVAVIYKNSTSSSTSYTRTSSMGTPCFSSSNPAGNSAFCLFFKGNTKTIRYRVANGTASTYGLYPEVTYVYHIIYSQ